MNEYGSTVRRPDEPRLQDEDTRLRGIVRAQARFLRWIADNYKGVDLDIVRARANELDALAARGEAS